MKRPRWLGGRESAADEDNDGETAEESAGKQGKRAADESKPAETAAERSARRTAAGKRPDVAARSSSSARKTLGERVGKATGDSSEESDAKAGPGARPKARPGSESKQPVKSGGKPKSRAEESRAERPDAERPKRKPDPKSGEHDDAAKKEVHRPRRQPDDERRRRAKPATGERTRGRDKPSGSGKAESSGESAKSEKPERKPIGPRVSAATARFAGALRRGAVGTRKYLATAAPKVGLGVLTVLGAGFTVFFLAFGFVLNVLIKIWLFIARPVGWVVSRLSRLTNAASRSLTPIRALAVVVAGAAVLLALSQFADYRSISIGNDAYSGVQTVAPAPETGRLETGDAHSYVFVPIAIACLLLLGGALTGRRRLCRPIALAGAAAIVVALVVDRPAGLDPGDAALAFNGVNATLLGGFYAQIAAGILLIGSSSLLARELRLADATEPSRREPGREGERKRGTGKGALRRPGPDAGGARA